MATVQIIHVTPCIIPEFSDLKRAEIRPIELQQEDYKEKYDYKTLSYDVFQSGDKIIFSGPPSFGLEDLYSNGVFLLNDNPVESSQIKTYKLDRLQRNEIQIDSQNKINCFEWQYNDLKLKIESIGHKDSTFDNKKTLVTVSKNNQLHWIRDWIKFHIAQHQIDAVLLYDNHSTQYTINELKEYLQQQIVEPIEIVLVPWYFTYGPIGVDNTGKRLGWDSNFCQYGALEHAKSRFLDQAYGVLNLDIDELLISKNNKSIFDKIDNIKGFNFPGKWIENIPNSSRDDINFINFFYYDKERFETTKKWCINPRNMNDDAQWSVHHIENDKLIKTKKYYLAHFKAISTSWHYDRNKQEPFNPEIHRAELRLKKNLESAFKVSLYIHQKAKYNFFENLLKYWK